MKNKKVLALTIAVLITFSGLSIASNISKANEGKEKTKVETSAYNSYVKVETKNIVENNDFVQLDLKIPVVTGLKNKDYQEKLNYSIEQGVLNTKEEIEKSAKDYYNDCKKDGFDFRPYQLKIDYEVKEGQGIVSIVQNTYEYTGGANGMSSVLSINIKTGEEEKTIQLSDLFKEDSNYIDAINSNIKEQIKERTKNGEYFFEEENAFKTIVSTQNFYINGDNLIISFQKYEIAPGSMGNVEFEIPMKDLNNYLK